MSTSKYLSVFALALSAVAFAGSPKTFPTVKGVGAIQTDDFAAIVRAEVKGAQKGRPARGDFDLYMRDANGNVAEFELRTIRSFTVTGKTAVIEGIAKWEIYGMGDDSGDGSPDDDDEESLTLTGMVKIVVEDLGNGRAGSTPDRVTVTFDDPDTDGVDLTFSQSLTRGNLTVNPGRTSTGAKK